MRLIRTLVLCLLPSLAAAQPIQPAQLLHTFTASPARPNGGLVQMPDGSLYGVTIDGIIRLSPGGGVSQVARFHEGTGAGALVRASDGALYGTTFDGGPANRGTVFRYDPNTGELRRLHGFESTSDGTNPLPGLVAVGGSLYGVTQSGPGRATIGQAVGTIFHVVVATGAVVTDASFVAASSSMPAGPLTLGPDGRLYGTSRGGSQFGTLYAYDPVGGGLTTLHTFSLADGTFPKALTRGADGSLYGNASSGGSEGVGTLFRYTPASGQFERLYSLAPSNLSDGRTPGPLLAAADGHFYGATNRGNDNSFGGTLFRLRAGPGGAFTYETLRQFDRAVDGVLANTVLTQAADGLIYGYTTNGGPAETGTLFRFDPLGGGPPANPIAFSVLHAFPSVATWLPRAPALAADGLLYGVTLRGGANNRGAVYRLVPATGALTIVGAIPIDLETPDSSLVQGPDGYLYGTATASTTTTVTSILRVDPSTGAVTVAVAAVVPPSVWGGVFPGLVRTPAGQLFGARRDPTASQTYYFYRFDPVANTVTDVARVPAYALSLIASNSGDVLGLARFDEGGNGQQWRDAVVRLDPAAPSGYQERTLSTDIDVVAAVEGADGNLYVGPRGSTTRIYRVQPTTGAVSTACTLPMEGNVGQFSIAADGALYGVVEGGGGQLLFRCVPATGVATLASLPPSVGYLRGSMVRVGTLFFGTSFGRGVLPNEVPGGSLFQLAPAGATLPAFDSDADALPNAWETAYGLDPFDGAHGSGPGDDPDGDGRTNAQELADGTHPRGFVTRLFAEGASNAFFRTRFDLANPTFGYGAMVRARFLTDDGDTVATDLRVPQLGHLGLDPSTVPGLPPGTFSAIFESDAPLGVDRSMSWDASGYGSHLETGIAAPSTTWYFAEGSTSGEFSLFYLLQNPQATAVGVTVRYLRPFGLPPIDQSYTLPPASRTTIVVDAQGAELASTDVSAVITATAPIVAERAMYVNRVGQPFAAGHESAGVTAPALDWFLAEGATGTFFDLFVLIANPSTSAATVAVEYLRSSGPALVKTYTVPAQSRMTIWVDDEQLPAGSGQKPLAQGNVSTAVHVTNGVPVIVERAMWWPGPETTANFWYEAHNSAGATGTATRWLIGNGEVSGTDQANTYVLVANTADRAGEVTLSRLGDDGADSYHVLRTVALAPKSRTTIDLRSLVPPTSAAEWFGVLLESSGDDPVPIVVERATYGSPGGVFWGRGGNALATPLP